MATSTALLVIFLGCIHVVHVSAQLAVPSYIGPAVTLATTTSSVDSK